MKWSEIQLKDEEEELDKQTCASPSIPEDLSPYTVYTVLKESFGEPNAGFDPTKSEWAYELKVSNSTIEISDWKLGWWNIHVCARSDSPDEPVQVGKKFVELLQNQAQKYSKQIKSAVEETDSYILQNPFALYYQSAANIIEEIEQTTSSVSKPGIPTKEAALEPEDLCRSAFFLLIASFEGFLNLIYELYLKSELKDTRIYDRLSREQIDIKSRLAPVYCNCFKSDLIDSKSEPFRKFLSIINLRNDFIHANLTKAMKIPIIIDGGRRLMHFPTTRDKIGLPKSIDELGIEDLRVVRGSIDEMVEILLQDMKPRYRRELQEVMDKKFILIEIEDDETVIVMGDDYIG